MSKTLDLLIITPFSNNGATIDAVTSFVVNAQNAGQLPRHAKTRHAQGVAQAVDVLGRERFRHIMISNYLSIGPGITELWIAVENHRLFDGARIQWADALDGWNWQ